MRIIKNIPAPQKKRLYDFDKVSIGDAIDVESYTGCREMFRRWKIQQDRSDMSLKYVGRSPDDPRLFRFFVTQKTKEGMM